MKRNNDVSRRTFITTAAGAGVVAGMATVTMPITAMAEAGPAKERPRPVDPLETILSRYGSELGDVNRTR